MADRTALVVAKQLPELEDSGGRQRLAAFVRKYASMFDRVHVIGFGNGKMLEQPPNVRISSYPQPSRPGVLKTLKSSSFAARWWSPRLSRHIAECGNRASYIHVDFPQMLININLPIDVVDFHNIDSDLFEQRLRELPRLADVPLRLDLNRFRRLERSAVRRARFITCCSPSDAAQIIRWGGSPILVPNAVTDRSRSPISPLPPVGDTVRLLFVGAMDYGPNVEAVRWFIAEVMPLLQTDPRLGRIEFVIAGRGVTAAFDRGCPQTVRLVDRPVSIAEVYKQCHLVIAPLLSGSGTNIKVVEAAWHGRRVVMTRKAAHGIPFADELGTVADSAMEFSEAVVAEVCDPSLSERSSGTGARARQRFSWDQAFERFGEIVGEMKW